jgi:hypothetical protein
MKNDEALGLCERLRQLIKAGPGINLPAQEQLDLILAYIAHEFEPGSAVHDKILDVRDGFEVWFHPRKLIAPHADAIQVMQDIHADIDELEMALRNPGLPAEGVHRSRGAPIMA